jgi:hypothetical protein
VATPSRNLDRTSKQRCHHTHTHAHAGRRTQLHMTHRTGTAAVRARHRRASAPRGTASSPVDGERAEIQNDTWRRPRTSGRAARSAHSTREAVRFYRLRAYGLANHPCSSRLEPLKHVHPSSRRPTAGTAARLDSRGSPTRAACSSPAGIRPAYVGRARSCQCQLASGGA